MGERRGRRPRGAGRSAPGRVIAGVAVVGVLATGCQPGGTARSEPSAAGVEAGAAAEHDYLAPPEIVRAEVVHLPLVRAGVLLLAGTATPGAAVRLQAPEGDQIATAARRDGRWTLRMAPVGRPRMFALSDQVDARVVHAEGALILLPQPYPPALLARAGSGALVVDGPAPRPAIVAIDYDPSGFVAVSGRAPPRSAVRLFLDGAPAGLGHADERGRYAVPAASRRLSFDAHTVRVETTAGALDRRFTLTPPVSLTAPYGALATPDGWAVEWAPPGGGVQTTLALTPAGSG